MSDAPNGDVPPANGFPPRLDLPLPDRHACVTAAANAAIGWVRAHRATWGELPVEMRATTSPPPPQPPAPTLALDSAVAEALMSALALDGAALAAPAVPETVGTALAVESPAAELPAPVPSLDTEAFALFTPALAHDVTISELPEQAPSSDGIVEETLAPDVAAEVVIPVLALEGSEREILVSAMAFESPVEDTLALDVPVEVFTPLLVRNSAAQELPAEDSPEADRFGLRDLSIDDDAPAPHTERETIPALEFDTDTTSGSDTMFAAAETRSIGSAGLATVAMWARTLSGVVMPWWPQIAMLAVVLAIGATARVYWPIWTAAKPGVAVLESVPDGSQVIVDGKDMGATPLTATLAAGPHAVEFRFRKATRTVQLTVAPGGRIVQRVDWTQKPSGGLQVNTDPPGAKVAVDGVARGVTPLTLDDLTVGPHTLVLERGNGTIQRTVTVNATETTHVNEMIFPGWITVFSPFALSITEGSRPVRLDDRGQVMLPSGSHELRFENRALGYEEVRRVDVRSGAVTTLSVVPPKSSLSVTASVQGEVWLDGVSAGRTPLSALPVELGTREVVVRTAAGDERRFTVIVTAKPVTIEADFSKPAR